MKSDAMMEYDDRAWLKLDAEDLWIYDKLILSRTLGYVCGPAGVDVPYAGPWFVKPITNIMGMGQGSRTEVFTTLDTSHLAAGLFWIEVFQGPHLSVDLVQGQIDVIYQGIRQGPQRFSRWSQVDIALTPPKFLVDLSVKYHTINYEMIGDRIIEVHARANPDWRKHRARELIPVWCDEPQPPGEFVADAYGDRLGFIVIR